MFYRIIDFKCVDEPHWSDAFRVEFSIILSVVVSQPDLNNFLISSLTSEVIFTNIERFNERYKLTKGNIVWQKNYLRSVLPCVRKKLLLKRLTLSISECDDAFFKFVCMPNENLKMCCEKSCIFNEFYSSIKNSGSKVLK